MQNHKYGYTVICMKTTVELPDDLLIAAKKRAAELRKPLKALIEEGLRNRLKDAQSINHKKRKIHWVTVEGGLPKKLDIRSREAMHAWIQSNDSDRH